MDYQKELSKKIHDPKIKSIQVGISPKKLGAVRKFVIPLIILLLTIFGGLLLPARPTVCAGDKVAWQLTWSDEFKGADGSAVDSMKWSFDVGGKGWGNNELETYTSRTANAHLENGSLVIKAIKETFTGPDNITRNYTSARLLTKQKFSQAYGRFEARIKIPFGQGIWPAFWMLGDNIDTVHWPNCGEIDIMENIGREPSVVHGTFHGPGYSGGKGIGAAYTLTGGKKFSDDFHTFAVEWEPNVMRFYVDGNLYQTRTPGDLPAGASWVFDHPFFIILNVAVGGGWPGNPDATTVFPQQMLVDYVRVYKRSI
jgi:beta-glucanase (GH16 family)